MKTIPIFRRGFDNSLQRRSETSRSRKRGRSRVSNLASVSLAISREQRHPSNAMNSHSINISILLALALSTAALAQNPALPSSRRPLAPPPQVAERPRYADSLAADPDLELTPEE